MVGGRGSQDCRAISDVRVVDCVGAGSGVCGRCKHSPVAVERQIFDRDPIYRVVEIALDDFQIVVNSGQICRGGLKNRRANSGALDRPPVARVPSVLGRHSCLEGPWAEMNMEILGSRRVVAVEKLV